jgi:hypothetical protein
METKKRFVLGIDPGANGFMVILDLSSRSVVDSYNLKFLPDGQFDSFDCQRWLLGVLKVHDASIVRCSLESVHAIFGASAKATFQFGRCLGSLETFLNLLGIPFKPVQPKTWQKVMWEGIRPIVKGGKIDTKATSLSAAIKLFPQHDFRRTVNCKNADDNKVDATLLAYYSCIS